MAEGKHVFLSHAAEDASFAARLADLLMERGAEVVADADVSAGTDWSQAFRAAIETSHRRRLGTATVFGSRSARRGLLESVFSPSCRQVAMLPITRAISQISSSWTPTGARSKI